MRARWVLSIALIVSARFTFQEQILSGFKSALIPKDKFMKLVKPFSLTDQDYLHKCSDLKAAKKHSAFWGKLCKIWNLNN